MWSARVEGSAEESGSVEESMLELCLVPKRLQVLLSLPIIKMTGG